MGRQFILRSNLGDLEWGDGREQNREGGEGKTGCIWELATIMGRWLGPRGGTSEELCKRHGRGES